MARAPPSQRLEAVPEDDDKTLQWGLVDFLGRYHKHAIASDFPVPGSAVSRDELREAQYKAHIDGIRDRVDNIQARKGESVQEKVRHETFALKALIQKRVGSTLDRVGATLEEIDREVEAFDAEQGRSRIAKYIEEAVIEPPKPPPGDGGEFAGGRRRWRALAGTTEGEIAWNVAEKTHEFLKDRKELHDWWDSVRAGDSERLRILFLAGFTRPDQPDPLEPAIQTIALELAVRRGDAAMVELLLEFGADPNKKNAGGFGPIQSLWQFWGPTHAADRMTQRDENRRLAALADERRTVDMLVMLLASGRRREHAVAGEPEMCVDGSGQKGPRPGRLCAVAIWC